ncbi:MAG: hypothetical protein FWE76_03070 [Symbiobacteriaceae bacterium]|nr:hypothetical protein [Symbiobacteriaceae bacterium]
MTNLVDSRRKVAVRNASLASGSLQKRRKQAGLRFAVITVLLIFAVVLAWTFIRWTISAYWVSRVVCQTVYTTDFIVTVPGRGIILRDEMLCISPATGIVAPQVSDGDYVSLGQHIANIDNAQSKQAILNQIKDLEDDLEKYNASTALTLKEIDETIRSCEELLHQKSLQLRNAVTLLDQDNIVRLEKEIKEQNKVRFEKVSQRSLLPEDPEIVSEKLLILREQLEQANNEVIAPDEGLISFWIDGEEETFSLGSFNTFRSETILAPPIAVDSRKSREVRAGAALFKIVSPGPWRWSGLVPLDSWEHPTDWLVHFYYDSFSEDGEHLTGKISSWLVDSQEDKGIQQMRITVEFPQMIPIAIWQRGLYLEQILRETQGIVLQLSNLLEVTGVDGSRLGVLIVEEEKIKFTQISILDSDGDRILVDGLNASCELVINPSPNMIGLKIR